MKHLLNLICALTFTMNCYATHNDIIYDSESEEPMSICSPTECYTVIKTLGEGAFGKVYAVEDSAGNAYALKSYKNQEDSVFANNIFTDVEREYFVGQQMNHPNIIKSYDYFSSSSEGIPTDYLLLQLVKGQTIFKTPLHTFSSEQSLSATLQLIDGLKYAFSLGLMHLDLHIGNVMLSDEADVMIIDLASFCNFDELIYTFETYEQSLISEIQPHSTKRFTDLALKDKKGLQSSEKPIPFKVQNFFKNNPQLVEKLRKDKPAFFARKAAQASTSLVQTDTHDWFRLSMTQYYIDRITEMCVKIISKGQLSREDKLILRCEIKKVSWNYEADIEDGLIPDLSEHLDILTRVIENQI